MRVTLGVGVSKHFYLLVVLATLAALLAGGPVGCSRPDGESAGESDGEAAEESGKASEDGDKKPDSENDEDDADEAVPVEITILERGPIETLLRFSTNLEAEGEVQVVSQATRQLPVRQLLVEEGDEVGKGRVLLRLQNDELRTALARTEGQLAKARREYQRQTNLFEQQLISEQTYNEATYELEQLELALQDARRELGYTEVRAPIAGTVTQRHVSVGNQVTAGQPLFDLVDFDSIVARVYVPEKDLWRIRTGLEARIYAEGARGAERYGTVERIAPRVDPRSGTVKATIAIPRGSELLPGMYVSVELVTAVNDSAVLVPKKALIYDADQIFVFRLTGDGEVERLLVEARLEDRDNIEPAGLLEDGDRIVIAGQAGLKDGSVVRIVGNGAESAAAPVEDEAGE